MRKFFLCLITTIILCNTALANEVLVANETEATVPVIMYHLVTTKQKYIGKYGITPAELKSDLEYLKNNNFNTIVFKDLINFVEKGISLPKNPIILTFDDGNFGDYEFLLPLLKEYNQKAIVAVIGSAADKYTKMEEENSKGRYPNLNWPQIKELHESGFVEIQNHSYDLHGKLGSGKKQGESPENYHLRLKNDLLKLQQACEIHLNYKPTAYVYPLGVISDGSREVLIELGIRGSFSCQEGQNLIKVGDNSSLFKLQRTNRPSGRGIEEIIKSIVAP